MPKKLPPDLDSFLDTTKKVTRCTTCREVEKNPELKRALERYEERRTEGTTTVGVLDLFNWLSDRGLLSGGSWHRLRNHFTRCRKLSLR